MQNRIFGKLKNDNGSAIISVVVLSAVLAIAAAGLMGASRNTVNQEVDAYNDARAYLAAETGLMIATRALINNGNEDDVPDTIVHDGIRVSISTGEAPDAGDNFFLIMATAHMEGILPYNKQLGWEAMGSPPNPGDWAYFVGKSPSDGMRRTTVFDGPVHFNTSMILSNSDLPLFRGNVTVNNTDGFANSAWGTRTRNGYSNNYGIGMRRASDGSGNYTTAMLHNETESDRGFMQRYSINNEAYSLSLDPRPSGLVPGSTTIVDELAWHQLPIPATNPGNSFLRFGITVDDDASWTSIPNTAGTPCAGSRCYTFFYQDGSGQWVAFSRSIPNTEEGLVILVDGFNLNVRHGMVSGAVTVATISNNINIDISGGNIVYADYDIPTDLPSRAGNQGDMVRVNEFANRNYQNQGNYNIHGNDLLAFYSETGNIQVNNNTARVITAQIIARDRNVTFNNFNNNNNCTTIFGTMVTNEWWAGNDNVIDMVRVFHDNRGLTSPGLTMTGAGSGSGSGGGAGNLVISGWRERNCLPGNCH